MPLHTRGAVQQTPTALALPSAARIWPEPVRDERFRILPGLTSKPKLTGDGGHVDGPAIIIEAIELAARSLSITLAVSLLSSAAPRAIAPSLATWAQR